MKIEIQATARLYAALADVSAAKNYIHTTFGITPYGPTKNDHGIIEFEIDYDERGKAGQMWKSLGGTFDKPKKDSKGNRWWTLDLGGGRTLQWRRDDYEESSYIALLDKKAAKSAPINPGLLLLKAIANRCYMPPPNKNNTDISSTSLSYSANHGNSQQYNAEPYLKHLGFVSKLNDHGGGSSRGDFSSDIYSTTFTHGRVTVNVGSSFRSSPRVFVSISGPAEELTAIEAKL